MHHDVADAATLTVSARQVKRFEMNERLALAHAVALDAKVAEEKCIAKLNGSPFRKPLTTNRKVSSGRDPARAAAMSARFGKPVIAPVILTDVERAMRSRVP